MTPSTAAQALVAACIRQTVKNAREIFRDDDPTAVSVSEAAGSAAVLELIGALAKHYEGQPGAAANPAEQMLRPILLNFAVELQERDMPLQYGITAITTLFVEIYRTAVELDREEGRQPQSRH